MANVRHRQRARLMRLRFITIGAGFINEPVNAGRARDAREIQFDRTPNVIGVR